jgi:hypothetical protein
MDEELIVKKLERVEDSFFEGRLQIVTLKVSLRLLHYVAMLFAVPLQV